MNNKKVKRKKKRGTYTSLSNKNRKMGKVKDENKISN